MDEYLGEQALQVAAAPPRSVYIVPQGDRATFRQAVREASSRWAGVTELIIPMRKSGKVDSGWLQMLEAARVETVVNVGCDPSLTAEIAAKYGLSHIDISRVHRAPGPKAMHWSAVAPRSEPIAARKGASIWELVAAGDPEAPTDGPPLASVRTWATEDFAGRAAIAGETVLDAGLAGFAEYESVDSLPGAPALIWLTPPNHLSACVWFWNLRALRPLTHGKAPMILLPTSYRSWVGLKDQIGAMMARSIGGDVDVIIQGHGTARDQTDELAEYLGFERCPGSKVTFGWQWPPVIRRQPFKYMTEFDPRTWLLFERRAGYQTTTRVQRFRQRTAGPLDVPSLKQAIPSAIGFSVYLRFSGGFLAEIPRTERTAKLVHENARWRGAEFELQSVFDPDSVIELASPEPHQLLEAVRQAVGASSRDSDKGRLAAAISEVRSCAVLLDPEILALIGHLRTPRSKGVMRRLESLGTNTPTRELAEIARVWGSRADRHYASISSLGGAKSRDGLERLVMDGWAERGLELRCSRCGVNSFITLSAVTNAAICPGCGESGKYSAAKSLDVMYRLDALVDRASDQGALPHVAALMALRQRNPETHLSLGLEVEWPDGKAEEVDLFGYMGAQLVSGEVKTSASEFDPAQIERDVALSRRLGAELHVMAATEAIPSTEIRRAHERCEAASMTLLVLMPSDDSGMAIADIQPLL